MNGGELFDRVVERKKFSEEAAATASKQMLRALSYIHGLGVAHRDVKLENFMYESKDKDDLKLIDFGFSEFCEDGARMRADCGTLSYAAPEVIEKQPYSS